MDETSTAGHFLKQTASNWPVDANMLLTGRAGCCDLPPK
jgi:hypothetical protein